MESLLWITLRSTIVYLCIVIGFRLFGKKELAQLSVFDFVFILLISNSVQNAMVGPDTSLEGGLVAAFTLFVVNYFIKILAYKYKLFNTILEGNPVMLVYEGTILENNLKEIKMTTEELMAVIREHGVNNIDQVSLVILEINGSFSVLSSNYKTHTKHKGKNKNTIN